LDPEPLPDAPAEATIGSLIARGKVPAQVLNSVDVLTVSGQITRHPADALPPDAFVVAARLVLPRKN
jgi:hypothetical protein